MDKEREALVAKLQAMADYTKVGHSMNSYDVSILKQAAAALTALQPDGVVMPSKMTLMNAAFALECPEEVPKEKRISIAQKLLAAAKESEQTHVRVPVDKLTISDCYRFGIDISSIRSTATGKESEHGK